MTLSTDARVEFSESEVITPRLRHTARRSIFWIVIALILVVLAVVSLLTYGVTTSKATLSATNPGPSGAEALIKVLRQDGVTARAPRTLSAAISDAKTAVPTTTMVLYDPTSILDAAQLGSLGAVAPNLVLIEPSAHELSVFAPGVVRAGTVAYSAKADCSYRPLQRAGAVSGLAQGYRVSATGLTTQGCLGSAGVYSLVRVSFPNQTVTVLGTTAALTNQTIPLSGNAALALGLFGSTTHLVWYRPSFADQAGVVADGALPAPPWVFLSALLAGLVVIAAGIWRGRRLGPVVVERMPVTVRASETVEGRARLYARASARAHALDALRIGAITRIAASCGLPTLADLDEIVGRVGTLTGRPTLALRELLVDQVPSSDVQLVRLSDELRRLEEDVAAAVVPR